MDTNNWRPNPPGGEPAVDTGDWRAELPPDSRQMIVNKIMETLKRHLPFSGQEGLQELKKIAVRFEEKIYSAAISQQDYLQKISLKMLTMENKSQNTMPNPLQSNSPSNSNKPPDPASLDSTAETAHANGADWQEEGYQKIKAMKETYLPELNEMHQKIAAKFQQNESLPQQPKPEQLKRLKVFKAMLEQIITFLQVPKPSVGANFKEKLDAYEKQIINFIKSNRPRKVPSQQLGGPGQLLPTQMHSMQQSQSQITQIQSHENPMNPQAQSMNLQGSAATMQQNSMSNLQHSSLSQQNMMNSLQPGSNLDSGQGIALNSMQQVPVGSVKQNPVNAPQHANMNALSTQSGVTMLQQNINPLHSNSNVLQHQNLKQQQEQKILQTQQYKQQYQQRQMQQQLHQPARQQMPVQQMAQLHQMNNVGEMKMRQGIGAKPGMFQQHLSASQRQNSDMQNVSNVSQNSLGNSMGQGMPSNMFTNSQSTMSGRQQMVGQQQQQQEKQPLEQQEQLSQNTQLYLYQQQLLMKQKFQRGNRPHLLMQSHIQQQQNILQPQLQSFQQSGMQTSSMMHPSLMQSSPLSSLQQNQHSSVQQSTQSMLQQHQQNVIDQKRQLYQSQRALPETSTTSLDSTAETGHANRADWQERGYQKEWMNYVCQVSDNSNTCVSKGRLIPKYYNAMTAAANLSYALYEYSPFLGLGDCTFVQKTFGDISKDYYPGLKSKSKLIYTGLVMVSAAVMISLIFWVFYARVYPL